MSEPGSGRNLMRCRRTGQGVCVKIGGGSCVCATTDECPFKLVEKVVVENPLPLKRLEVK